MAKHTAVECLVAVARHHGLDLSADRLVHDFALGEEEPATDILTRMAQQCGLAARPMRLDWDRIAAQAPTIFPLILRLSNGNSVVALGFAPGTAASGDVDQAAAGSPAADRATMAGLIVADPLADGAKHLPVSRAQLEAVWSGEAVLMRREYAITDADQPFGLRWFVEHEVPCPSLSVQAATQSFVLARW